MEKKALHRLMFYCIRAGLEGDIGVHFSKRKEGVAHARMFKIVDVLWASILQVSLFLRKGTFGAGPFWAVKIFATGGKKMAF